MQSRNKGQRDPRVLRLRVATAVDHSASCVFRAVIHAGEMVIALSTGTPSARLSAFTSRADPALGSGIIGLIDRVDAMGGKLTLRSPLGEGT